MGCEFSLGIVYFIVYVTNLGKLGTNIKKKNYIFNAEEIYAQFDIGKVFSLSQVTTANILILNAELTFLTHCPQFRHLCI